MRVKYRGRTITATQVDRRTAERWAAEKGAEIRKELHFEGESNRNRLLAELIDRYMKHVLPRKRDPRNGNRQLLWWRERLGAMKVREVTRAVVSQCRDELGAVVGGKVARGRATVTRYQLKVVATGFSKVLGLAFDGRDRRYVLESSYSTSDPGPEPFTGRLIRILPNGKQEILIDAGGPLFLPTGMTFGPDGALYISNIGFGPPPVGLGQIIKVTN